MSAAAVQLRQEREAFNQNKAHAAYWFKLKLRMGYVAVLLFISLLILCGFVLLQQDHFSSAVVTGALIGILADGLGLAVAAWKLILSPGETALPAVTRRTP